MNTAKSFTIGIFVLIAIIIAIYIISFIHPPIGNEERLLTVRFANIDRITVGTRVSFAGKPVGIVRSITELPDAIDKRINVNGSVYAYELILAVDSSVNIYNTDLIASHLSGLLGETSINIEPRPAKSGENLVLLNDKVIYAQNVKSVDEMFKMVSDVMTEVQNRQLIGVVADTISNLRDITAALNQPQEIKQTVDNISDLFDRIVKSWSTVDVALNNLADTTNNTKLITAKVSSGKGTAGQLVMNDDLYLNLNSALIKGDVILGDINQYGLLFQLNKNWQRLRARRTNLLLTLNTPQEFSNYFNDELCEIAASIERVSMAMGMAEDQLCFCELLNSNDFKKVIDELTRRVKALDDEVKGYSLQLFSPTPEPEKTSLIQYVPASRSCQEFPFGF